MQPYCINALLSSLIALTHERDEAMLEITLIKTLTKLIASQHGEEAKPVVIYYLNDEKQPRLSAFTVDDDKVDGNKTETSVSSSLQATIINSFQSGEICRLTNTNNANHKFYPLKNANGQIASVIGIAYPPSDIHSEITISMVLQIYQNYTNLINDNECDTLTGLLNRKTFEYKINKVLAHTQSSTKRREDKPDQNYFLAIFDIDHFKRVNDIFGHLIGDEVLLMFAQLMRQCFRESDPLFRFGGEEFVGVFECSREEDIKMILERFRLKVAQFSFPQVDKVTVSAGCTRISDFDTSSQLIDRADSALYFAKNHGRNRIAIYEQLIMDGELHEVKKEGDIEFF
ncbi:MAG: GGDEF domain-containing protein [Methylotenera sp.]|nr:GGDEF domain-containing protein [Methylotenera sp.]